MVALVGDAEMDEGNVLHCCARRCGRGSRPARSRCSIAASASPRMSDPHRSGSTRRCASTCRRAISATPTGRRNASSGRRTRSARRHPRSSRPSCASGRIPSRASAPASAFCGTPRAHSAKPRLGRALRRSRRRDSASGQAPPPRHRHPDRRLELSSAPARRARARAHPIEIPHPAAPHPGATQAPRPAAQKWRQRPSQRLITTPAKVGNFARPNLGRFRGPLTRPPDCAGSWRSTAAVPSDRRVSSAPPRQRDRRAASDRRPRGPGVRRPSGAPDQAPPRAPPRRAVPPARDRSCCGAMPVIRATATTPPRPTASASAAANRRRPRSSSTGSSAEYRNLIAVSSSRNSKPRESPWEIPSPVIPIR